jgi:VCBS repeat-containing protein
LPSQKLKACFDSHGAHFSGAGSLALHLVAYGRDNNLAAIKPVKPIIRNNRVNYAHGNLTAWWHVLPMGFEQGFTIAKPPAGNGKLALALTTSRQGARAPTHRHSREGGNPVNNELTWGKLRYGKLVVTDANGKVIPATLKHSGDRILIAVNDTSAAYPLTIDPLVWIEQKVTASNGTTNDGFGWSVAIFGSTAMIGAYGDASGGGINEGSVYVFAYKNGTWNEIQKLSQRGGYSGDLFGKSIALSRTTALISAPLYAGIGGEGVVYVFKKANDTWSQTQELTAANGSIYGGFGSSISLDGHTAIVGEPFANVGNNQEQGAAYIFKKSGGTWSQTQRLVANDGMSKDHFGWAVALSDSTVIVGAIDATVNGKRLAGAAYVFDEADTGWSQTQKLTVDDTFGHFGSSIALDGTTALIAPGLKVVYAFSKQNDTWIQTQKIMPNDDVPDAYFGSSIALDGDVALIGADAMTGIDSAHDGAAYAFTEADGSWNEVQKFTERKGMANDGFGFSVALDGSILLIGVGNSTIGANTRQGRAYFYGRSDLGLNVSASERVDPGSNYASQAIVTNNSSTTSPAIAVTIAVPAAASYVSAAATQGDCSEASGVVACNFGQISGNAGMASANVVLKSPNKNEIRIKTTTSVVLATPAITASANTKVGNQPPVASDGTLTTKENAAASGTLMASDPDGDHLIFAIVDKPSHGSVNLGDNGAYTYTPNKDYHGSDSFTFKANDGHADSNVATISITVKAAPPPPPPPPPPSGGGGGGSTGWPVLLALLGLALAGGCRKIRRG